LNTLLFFSNNQDKIKEIRNIFIKSKIKILSLNDFPKEDSPKETGGSFVQNAKIKSLYGFNKFGIPCFADDSGVCISALKNKPGIYSKNFLEKFESKNKLFNFIINKTNLKKNNYAYFQTSICLTLQKTHYVFFEGRINGYIVDKPRGLKGFGYDPIFVPNGHNKTFAEMSMSQKNILSHRSIAIKKMIGFLLN